METETLSNYDQPQERHVLDDMNINIPNHDDNSNSLRANETNDGDSDFFTESVRSPNKNVDEENCDEIDCNKRIENNITTKDNVDEEDDIEEDENRLSNGTNPDDEDEGEEEERLLLSSYEDDNSNNSLNDRNDTDESSLEDKSERNSVLGEELDKEEVEELDKQGIEELDREGVEKLDKQEVKELDKQGVEELDKVGVDERPLTEQTKVLDTDAQNGSDTDGESTKDGDTSSVINRDDGDNKSDDPLESDEKEAVSENNIKRDEEEDANPASDIKETKENNEEDSENKEINRDSSPNSPSQKNSEEDKDRSLLKETLTLPRSEDVEEKEKGETENGEEMDIDDDFDPSLLCPDIAMEVDEAPVITATDNVPMDGNKSPLLYEPVYSTYVDEMTGAEVTFNLSPEEHLMRQEMYGENNPVQFTKIHCTACNIHLGSALDGQGNRFVHPLLKVLICKNCYHFYTSGEFEKDEDGSELYCRWCGQGGQVMCCSACEMVFCKKCIRINFGRKKLTDIRDSDDWFCFRCNPSQLTELRVHCAEFMEYVRRETSRAATLENATSFMTTDYTQCCLAQKKKLADPNATEPKKRRRRHLDPDYDPSMDLAETSSPTPEVKPTSTLVPILPKPISVNDGSIAQKPSVAQGPVFRVGNTTFRPRGSFQQVRPIRAVSVVQGGVSTVVRPRATTPGYIKIMPSGIRATTPRQPTQTFVSTPIRPQSFQQRQQRMPGSANHVGMKHEWFEKTVRAAARVNSNLSYTLTQLNRAQATASSVEALAVVHNKLQEILSTSINSLIQIRKNLRAEFIAGIKNIRTPPAKPPQPMPSTSAQDDDVIFVSPTTSPVPPPIPAVTVNNLPPSVTLTNSSNIIKRNTVPIVPTTTLQLIPTTNTVSVGDKPVPFLRVKSLSALQSVPSECITIPDDPVVTPPSPPVVQTDVSSSEIISEDAETKAESTEHVVSETTVTSENADVSMVEESSKSEEDPLSVKSEEKRSEDPVTEECVENEETEKDKEVPEKSNEEPIVDAKVEETDIDSDKIEELSNLPAPDPKKVNELKVHIVRSKEVDELISRLREDSECINGDTLE